MNMTKIERKGTRAHTKRTNDKKLNCFRFTYLHSRNVVEWRRSAKEQKYMKKKKKKNCIFLLNCCLLYSIFPSNVHIPFYSSQCSQKVARIKYESTNITDSQSLSFVNKLNIVTGYNNIAKVLVKKACHSGKKTKAMHTQKIRSDGKKMKGKSLNGFISCLILTT